MANPGLDEHNVEADDVLAPERQSQLRELTDRPAAADFDRVALEVPRELDAELNDQYRAVRDDFEIDDEPLPDGPVGVRNEVVQVGFRLAERLDHDQVHAVDSRPPIPDTGGDWSIAVDAEQVPYPIPDFEAMTERETRRLRESTLLEYFREMNSEPNLQDLHTGNAAASLLPGDDPPGDDYAGATQFGHWYERNSRMAQNVWAAAEPGDDVLFLVGGSHVLPPRQVLDAAPPCCPVSPLPLLGE